MARCRVRIVSSVGGSEVIADDSTCGTACFGSSRHIADAVWAHRIDRRIGSDTVWTRAELDASNAEASSVDANEEVHRCAGGRQKYNAISRARSDETIEAGGADAVMVGVGRSSAVASSLLILVGSIHGSSRTNVAAGGLAAATAVALRFRSDTAR